MALVTDGRMSGASGKVPNAIHMTPEALSGGNFAKVIDGDIIELDLENGTLQLYVSDDELAKRIENTPDLSANQINFGRELFNKMRPNLSNSEDGATLF